MFRYFFVSYVATKEDVQIPFFGNIAFEAEAQFPNKKEFTRQLKEMYGYSGVSVISVQEWTEDDFFDWVVDPSTGEEPENEDPQMPEDWEL
jgi:hypothetical protein